MPLVTPDPELSQCGVPASSREARPVPSAMKQGGLLREQGAQRGTLADLFIYHKSYCDMYIGQEHHILSRLAAGLHIKTTSISSIQRTWTEQDGAHRGQRVGLF